MATGCSSPSRRWRDRTAAEALRGAELSVPESSLPPLQDGEWWPHDLEGCRVRTEAGRDLGTLTEVIFNPANDLWVSVDEAGVETLVPALRSLLVEVDVAAKRVVVRDVPGLTVPEDTGLEVGHLRERRDLLEDVAVPVALDHAASLQVGHDAAHVLAAPAAQAREVRVRHRWDHGPVGGKIGEGRRAHLQESLRDAALEIEEEEVVDERLVLLDLPSERRQDLPRGARARPPRR